MKARSGRAVRIQYELRVKGGPAIESSEDRGPATFVVGRGRALPALERRILGLAPGEEAHGEIPFDEAQGDLPRMEIALTEFPGDAQPEAGGTYEARTLEGRPVRFKVLNVGERTATVQLLAPQIERDIEYHVRLLAVDSPPPPPARAVGIDSAAIRIVDVDEDSN